MSFDKGSVLGALDIAVKGVIIVWTADVAE